jgi:hypothetical protein
LKRRFEILTGLPAYGDMYISFPENGYNEFSEGLAVKFIRKDNSEWIGNFSTGNSILKFAVELENSDNILIIAYGVCYIVNLESKQSLIEFGYDFRKVFQYKNRIILIGEYLISVVESVEKIKDFDNLCCEGITNIELEDSKITGILHDYKFRGNDTIKRNFSLNLETLELLINVITESQKQSESNRKAKKWWEIWK